MKFIQTNISYISVKLYYFYTKNLLNKIGCWALIVAFYWALSKYLKKFNQFISKEEAEFNKKYQGLEKIIQSKSESNLHNLNHHMAPNMDELNLQNVSSNSFSYTSNIPKYSKEEEYKNRYGQLKKELAELPLYKKFFLNLWRIIKHNPVKAVLSIILYGALCILKSRMSLKYAVLNGELLRRITQLDKKGFYITVSKYSIMNVFSGLIGATQDMYKSYLRDTLFKKAFAYSLTRYMHNDNFLRVQGVADLKSHYILSELLDQWAHTYSHFILMILKYLIDVFIMGFNFFSQDYKLSLLGICFLAFNSIVNFQIYPNYSDYFSLLQKYESTLFHNVNKIKLYCEEICFLKGSALEVKEIEYVNNKIAHIRSQYWWSRMYTYYSEIFITHKLSRILGLGLVYFFMRSNVLGLDIKSHSLTSSKRALVTETIFKYQSLLQYFNNSFEKFVDVFKDVHTVNSLNSLVYDYMQLLGASNDRVITNETTITPDSIELKNVKIVAPDSASTSILSDLNLKIIRFNSVMIVGESGCGKSSIFRVIANIWGLNEGEISRPDNGEIFCITQNAYVFNGTLLEQIIYPQKLEDFYKLGHRESEAYYLLEKCDLEQVIKISKGLMSEYPFHTLSGGEKQKLCFARMLYHNKQFALVDSGTSQVSEDAERKLYQLAYDRGITLVTIGHRKQTISYHKFVVYINKNEEVSMKRNPHFDATLNRPSFISMGRTGSTKNLNAEINIKELIKEVDFKEKQDKNKNKNNEQENTEYIKISMD